MFRSTKAIYILGGMGPQASLELNRLLIEKAQKIYSAKNNNDYPEIVVHSVPVPDFISDDTNKDKALAMLVDVVKQIPKNHFSSFAICCNTAHILADDLRRATEVPFTSLIEVTTHEIQERGLKRVGLLASPMTIATKLYQKELQNYCIDTVLPKSNQLLEIETAIKDIISNKFLSDTRKKLNIIAHDMINNGAEAIILGCTELPLAFESIDNQIFISSIDCLAAELLDQYYN